MYLVKGEVRIELESIGEGYNGDYNPDDIEDEELLRFYVQKREGDDWVDVEDASYCTCMPISATDEEMKKGLEILMGNFYDAVMSGESVKKLGERMSWISLANIRGDDTVVKTL